MSIWQTKSWQEMLLKSWQIEKIIEHNGVFFEKRKISLWQFWLFVLWLEESIINDDFLKDSINISKKEKCLFVQFETIDYTSILQDKEVTLLTQSIKKSYYKKFITPFTAIIDLNLSQEDILSKMKPKWRYNIKLAQKKWVEVLEVEKTKENIEIFYNLMNETTSRDWFSWNSFNYYSTFLQDIKESKLLIAYYENTAISAWIFTYLDDIAIYYYWASTSDKKYRNIMAPYLLQWEAINIWKNIWCKYYDFLWVATPWDNNSSLSWVTDFKLKLTPEVINVSDSYIFINNELKYFFINLLRKIKR